MPTVDVPLFEDSGMTVPNRPHHLCLHCGGAMHGGGCGEELNPLIESGQIDVAALNNDTTTVPDNTPPEPLHKSALLFRYNNLRQPAALQRQLTAGLTRKIQNTPKKL